MAARRLVLVIGLGLVTLGLSAGATWLLRAGPKGPPGVAAGTGSKATDPAAVVARGRMVYGIACASCHGPGGHGDGPAAAELKPPPRDLTAEPWTHGTSPAAIRQVIAHGIPGTAMPASGAALSAADLDAVVAFVQSLAPRPATAPPLPAELAALLRRAGFTPEEALRPAPSFDLRDTASGASVSLAPLAGKFVLVTFWGTGCVHCIKEFPRLERLAQHPDGKDIAIVCICADETDTAAVEAAARKSAGTLAVCVDPKGLAPVRYEVQAVPTVVLIDPNGRLLGRAQGVPDLTTTAFHSVTTGRQQD